MKQSAVVLARALAFIETYDLTPQGGVFYPDLVRELSSRYQFQKFPTAITDFDENKGVEFLSGKLRNTVIEKLVIYSNGLLVDTRVDTKTSEAIIHEALEWGREKFGLNYKAEMISRVAYVSQVTFYSAVVLDALHPALRRLAESISARVSEIQGERLDYKTSSLMITHDPLNRKYPVAGFTIFPRAETPYSENKYFSEAPLPTNLHINLLEQFEADLLRVSKPRPHTA